MSINGIGENNFTVSTEILCSLLSIEGHSFMVIKQHRDVQKQSKQTGGQTKITQVN